MACFHQTSVLMPEPTQPGRARVWVGALGVSRQLQATQRVRSRRTVGMVIAFVKEMLREFSDDWRSAFGGIDYVTACGQGSLHTLNYTFAIAKERSKERPCLLPLRT